MKTIRVLVALWLALAGASVAHAQSKQGYWISVPSGDMVWRSSTGLCWRAGYWTPAMAIAECDPDLTPKPAAAPAPAPAAKPAATPEAPKPAVLRVTLATLFDSNRTTLSPAAKEQLDKEVVAKLTQFASIQFININGHTDRLGSPQFNQKLSERRAETVKAYLVSRGADPAKIETYGFGKTQPVKSCPDQKDRKALIACLAPNRRVEIEVQGMPRPK